MFAVSVAAVTVADNMELAEIKVVTDGGPWAFHNMPCGICRKEKAVLDISTSVFHPCWKCQRDGWKLVKKRENRMKKLLTLGLCGALAFFLVTIYVAPETIGQEKKIKFVKDDSIWIARQDTNGIIDINKDWPILVLLYEYERYSAECYADSFSLSGEVYKDWQSGKFDTLCPPSRPDQFIVGSTGEIVKVWFHHTPTFPGFMQFLEKKIER